MSLFKSRDIWSYQCGKDETFDSSSVIVADIRNKGEDCIIVGSHAGYLRIFQPQSDAESDTLDYKPTDLFIEIQLENPILQVAVGKLVSGSPNNHLGVLHPHSIAAYSLHTLPGSALHGDQCHLVLAYEHQLKKSAHSLIIGPFGGAKGRDFICVQSLDGMLSFFEQETFAGNRSLPCFLLPSKIVYIQQSDSFVTLSANWYLESFRYDVLADNSGRKLAPSWSFNLGESVVDMCVVTWMGSEAALLVLGERNVYWFRDSGGLKVMKRLQYNACCFHVYVTEPEKRLMMLIVSDTATLLVYHETTLMWSSQLSFVPVTICKVNFKTIHGIILSLSESGALQCSYLGTEPSVFMAPPLDKKPHSYEEMQQTLADLNHDIEIHSQGNLVPLSVTTGHDLSISAHIVLIQSDPPECRLELLLTPTAPVTSVQVSVNVELPLKTSPLTHHLPSLFEQIYVESAVSFDMCCTVPLATLDVTVITVYLTGGQTPRVLHTTVPLPLAFAVKPATPFKEATHKFTISASQSVVPLSQLFSDFAGEPWSSVGCSDNAVGFALNNMPESVVTIITSKSSPRYRAQSESISAMCLIISVLVSRIESHHASKQKQVQITFQASALPLPTLLSAVDKHASLRNQLNVLQEELKVEAAQYRAIQRRLLAKLRDKTPTPLTSLDKLLKNSYTRIIDSARKYEDIQVGLELCNCELSCIVRLILLLSKLAETTSINDLADLASALAYTHHQADDQGWEEVCESGITYLLRTSLAKSVRDQQRTNFRAIKDVARFKKHIAAALDRVVTGNQNKFKEDNRAVSPILEGDEEAMSAHSSRRQSVEGLSKLKLLPARKSVRLNVPPSVPSGSDKDSALLDDDDLPW